MVSPDSLLKARQGHCFEVATLLCSLLIGHGFEAYVVSGYATREVTTNDQRRVVCPEIAMKLKERITRQSLEEQRETPTECRPQSKYKLKEPIDLKSKFLKQLDDEETQRVVNEEATVAAQEAEIIRLEETLSVDELATRRIHSWVLMLEKKEVFFIEPSTGFRHEIDDTCFVGIEALWNHENYMVNKQQEIVGKIPELNWILQDRDHWERLLDVDSDYPNANTHCPKYLDMPLSWVQKFRVSPAQFEQRFPEQHKATEYKRCIHERFAVYKEMDGLVERIRTFEGLDYGGPLQVWEYYRNRADRMYERVRDHAQNETMERFFRGRRDALKSMRRIVDTSTDGGCGAVQEFEFFYRLRFDCLQRIEMSQMGIREFYRGRDDRLVYRHFRFTEEFDPKEAKERINCLESIEEHFERDASRPALGDIAVRKFIFLDNKIFLQYHYEDHYITATTREFIKPPKPCYGEEIRFEPEMTQCYKSNLDQPDPSNIELYHLLLEQLQAEATVIKAFLDRCNDLQQLRLTREREIKKSTLLFSLFDPLRNEDAKRIRLQRINIIAMREESDRREQADFLGPYLLKHSTVFVELCSQIQGGSISYEASKEAFEDCLSDYVNQQRATLSDVEQLLLETEEEVVKFKEFITKFQDQFTAENSEDISKEGEALQRFRNVLQMRLKELRAKTDQNVEQFRRTLLSDDRLNAQFRDIQAAQENKGPN